MEKKSDQRSVSVMFKAFATQGPGWALTRARLILWNRLGVVERRTPLQPWSDVSLADVLKDEIPNDAEQYCRWRQMHSPPFFFEQSLLKEGRRFVGEGSIQVADRVLNGEFPFFSHTAKVGFPPDWQRNPISKVTAPGAHWSKINEFASGDIKHAWEINRFSWAFALVRAYARTQDDRYAEAFWKLYESWLEANPPNWGINWKCGQEASFRVMGLCFAFYAFAGSAPSTPARVSSFVTAIAIFAKRVDAYIEYAQSQKNNHGMSEGVGLWTIGLLFPELRGAESWRIRGKEVIERESRRQIYADGSYVQHSPNYHRVMLHDLAWAIRLGERTDIKLSNEVYDNFRKATHFLHALTDPLTGWAPNGGGNDGALVLPLSDCEYPDMRPLLQCCQFISERKPLYPAGLWDEEMVWLNGTAALNAECRPREMLPVDLDAAVGGYYTIRSDESWVMLRGAKYMDRPSHADQLHLDLWWKGEAILCDSGTYSYNAPAPFDDGFASSRYHNTVTVDGLDQMTRLSRFLWADWAVASVRRYEDPSRGLRVLEGQHDGYAKTGVLHRRAVGQFDRKTWIVVDDLTGGHGEHTLRLHWLAPEVPFQSVASGIVDMKCRAGNVRLFLASNGESQFDLVRAGERVAGEGNSAVDPARGWHSRYYSRKHPALSFVVETSSPLPVRFITVVTLDQASEVKVIPSFDKLQMDSQMVKLSPIGEFPIFETKI